MAAENINEYLSETIGIIKNVKVVLEQLSVFHQRDTLSHVITSLKIQEVFHSVQWLSSNVEAVLYYLQIDTDLAILKLQFAPQQKTKYNRLASQDYRIKVRQKLLSTRISRR
ncbi:MAG: hypothetical protein R2788_19175 [Saprospiraceae bacterium]